MPSLNQRILVLTQGPANEPGIQHMARTHAITFKAAVEQATGLQVSLSVYIPDYIRVDLRPADFMDYGGTWGKIAFFNKDFDKVLVKSCGVKAHDFDYIIRVYKHPPVYPTGFLANTWKWYNEYLGVPLLKKGYTSIIVNPPPYPPPAPLWEIMLHEYCHQLQHRFEDAGVMSFVNPDRRGPLQTNPLFRSVSNVDFYNKTLANLEFAYNGRQAVPYQVLHGVAGIWR